jgi:predicted nucleic acid-binding protein
VSPAAGNAVIDACTLQNFVVVDRLDLLKERFTGHAYWTEAIQYEAGRLGITDTGWLGRPIEVGDGVAEIIQIQAIRRALGARRAEPATLHLGEAEAIHYIETREPSWSFISDDQPAVDFARHRGIDAIDTQQVLADCYEDGKIGCPEAFDLLLAMQTAGRGVRIPPSHWYICPPKQPDLGDADRGPDTPAAADA